MDIIKAARTAFKQIFTPSIESYTPWFTFLKAIFGLPMADSELEFYRLYTGRTDPPDRPVKEVWTVAGRRSGKSFISAFISCFLALFFDYRKYLSPGEIATVLIIAASRDQAKVIFSYISGFLHSSPIFEQYIQKELTESILLTNGVEITVMPCSYRTVRGRTVVACILDEISFWHVDGANPDKEILTALRPAMATIPNSMLLALSSPYAKRGVLYEHHRDYYGENDSEVLIWQSPTTAMNPLISQGLIDRESKKDKSAARAEWYAEFREDIETFLNTEALEACAVLPGNMSPDPAYAYQAFIDPSGGRIDSMTVAIGYQDPETLKLKTAYTQAWDPHPKKGIDLEAAVAEIADILKEYNVSAVTGDRYGAGWVESAFKKQGIVYVPADKPKSDLYLSFEGYVNTQRVEIPNDKRLIREFLALERKRGKQGKDKVDHPPRGRDDLANSVAGLCHIIIGSEKSYFHNCSIGPEPLGVNTQGNVVYHGKELKILRTVGAIALPGKRAGYFIAAAEATLKDERYLLIAKEITDRQPGSLIKRVLRFKRGHSDLNCIYGRRYPFIDTYNRQAQQPLSLIEPPYIETAGPHGAYIHNHLAMVRDKLTPENKRVLFYSDSKLPEYLSSVSTEDAAALTDWHWPAVAAISYLTAAVFEWIYDPAEQQLAEAYNDDLSLEFDY